MSKPIFFGINIYDGNHTFVSALLLIFIDIHEAGGNVEVITYDYGVDGYKFRLTFPKTSEHKIHCLVHNMNLLHEAEKEDGDNVSLLLWDAEPDEPDIECEKVCTIAERLAFLANKPSSFPPSNLQVAW